MMIAAALTANLLWELVRHILQKLYQSCTDDHQDNGPGRKAGEKTDQKMSAESTALCNFIKCRTSGAQSQ
jgi:hypothetical protein